MFFAFGSCYGYEQMTPHETMNKKQHLCQEIKVVLNQ